MEPIPSKTPIFTPAKETDEQLFERYAVYKDENALLQLLKRHQALAYRIALTICKKESLAEEVVQESILSLLAAAQTNKPPRSVLAWFCGVVINKARLTLRDEKRTSNRFRCIRPGSDPLLLSVQKTAPQKLEKETVASLQRALLSLEEDLRLPIVLHYMEGATEKTIGECLSISQQCVHQRIAKGLALLRKRLNRDDP
jgi:RNA polymerase sigma-70 factor (ECF subfamily)